jgi:hypothetical protein
VGLVAIDEVGRRKDAFGDLGVRVGRLRLHHSYGGTPRRKRLP